MPNGPDSASHISHEPDYSVLLAAMARAPDRVITKSGHLAESPSTRVALDPPYSHN